MSMRALVASALTLDESDADVIMCCQKLDHEMVRDVASLAKTWEEVKMALPGAARWHIGHALAVQSLPTPSPPPSPPGPADFERQFSLTYWIQGAAVSALLVVGPIILGILTWDQTGDLAGAFDATLWYYCWGPLIALLVLELLITSALAPRIGWDMIEQHSKDADLREALKDSMETQGLVAALFLTVVWGMLQSDPIQGDATLIISQWYQGLLVLSIALTMIGTVSEHQEL